MSLLCVQGLTKGFLTNPTVPQGGSNSFSSTGTESPGTGLTWDILNSSSTTIATSSSANGWSVSLSGSTFTVGAPSSATIATNYKVRYTGSAIPPPDPSPAARALVPPPGAKSALFDVVAGATPPTAPSGLTAQAESSSQIHLYWNDNSSDETGFKIERKTGSGGTFAQIGTTSANVNVYTSSGLSANTHYYYRVRAYNSGGNSSYSNEADATTPTPLGNLQATPGNNSVGLTWQGPDDAEYSVMRSDSSSGPFVSLATTTNKTYTDSPVRNNVVLYYRIESGEETSNTVSVTPNDSRPHFEIVDLSEARTNQVLTATLMVVNSVSGSSTSYETVNGILYTTVTTVNNYLLSDTALMDQIVNYTHSMNLPHLGITYSTSGVRITTDKQMVAMRVGNGNGGDTRLFLYKITTWSKSHMVNGSPVSDGGGTTYDVVQRDDCNYMKLAVNAVPVDSRLVYGQPNLEGELTADPNADLRHVNFNGWQFKGGLLVGNAPDTSSDMSGTARTQLYVTAPQTGPTEAIWSALTLLFVDTPSTMSTHLPIGLFRPLQGSENYGIDPAVLNWSSRWNLGQCDYLSNVALTGTSAKNEYANFQVWYGGFGPKLVIALKNEEAAIEAHSATWKYFANGPYANIVGEFARPRYWLVDRTYHSGNP